MSKNFYCNGKLFDVEIRLKCLTAFSFVFDLIAFSKSYIKFNLKAFYPLKQLKFNFLFLVMKFPDTLIAYQKHNQRKTDLKER